MSRFLIVIAFAVLSCSSIGWAESPTDKPEDHVASGIEQLKEPLYSPFIERYVLDEIKSLRVDLGAQRAEFIKELADRQVASVDRTVTYATDTITYFFYLIAGVSSVLVLVGWTSIRDIKDKVHTLADEEISSLVKEYEERLQFIEQQLNQKTKHIKENREEIELTQEVQSLWLRAAQETNPTNKIGIYDQILEVRPNDCEALTYKADAVLELDEPQWAINLCRQALALDPDNSHAFYQLACGNAALGHLDEAIHQLSEALNRSESYRADLSRDEALKPLHELDAFQQLLHNDNPE